MSRSAWRCWRRRRCHCPKPYATAPSPGSTGRRPCSRCYWPGACSIGLRARAGRAIAELLALQDGLVRRLVPDGTVREVPVAAIRAGESILLGSGERLRLETGRGKTGRGKTGRGRTGRGRTGRGRTGRGRHGLADHPGAYRTAPGAGRPAWFSLGAAVRPIRRPGWRREPHPVRRSSPHPIPQPGQTPP